MVKFILPEQIFTGFSTVDREPGQFELHDLELVKRDLLNEFLTPKGHRRRLPDFGSIIPGLLFEPLTPAISELIEDDVKRIIDRDARVTTEEVLVGEFEHGFVVSVTLFFKPTETLEQFQINFDRRLTESRTDTFGF